MNEIFRLEESAKNIYSRKIVTIAVAAFEVTYYYYVLLCTINFLPLEYASTGTGTSHWRVRNPSYIKLAFINYQYSYEEDFRSQ